MSKKNKLESFFKEEKQDKLKIDAIPFKINKQNAQNRKLEIKEYDIKFPYNLEESILLSVDYDGQKAQTFVKLYSIKQNKIFFWYDNTNHHPYCLTDFTENELKRNQKIMEHKGLIGFKKIRKIDLLHDRQLDMIEIQAGDPLSIGGRGDSIREILSPTDGNKRSWEDRIRYHHSYIMDRSLTPGATYTINKGTLKEIRYDLPEDQLTEIKYRFKKDLLKYEDILKRYLPRILDKVPFIKRTAMDIEVEAVIEDRIPDAKSADHPVTAISFASNSNENEVYLLATGSNLGKRPKDFPDKVAVEFFEDEKELLVRVFNKINEIPILITFNGDNFDLKYLYYRALKLGLPEDKIPIKLTSDSALIRHGIHIDLYTFFHNVSIRVYAFGNKYIQSTLNSIAKALLGQEKIGEGGYINNLTPLQLAHYCWTDAKLTLDLTTFNEELTIKLIILLMRISHLPLEDVTRTAVSAWIRNLIFYEHRQKNYLIPNPEDILKEKGEIHSQAVIKGKKFKGAIVIEPTKGIHFNVTVLDFASLYPSIIKEYNLSYETVECPDPDCRKNILPGTDYCVCKKRTGILSAIVGFLRDIRVNWFKTKSKDITIPDKLRQYYKVIEQALKVFINASYGVLGSENFPLYTPPVADATTAIGRYAITKVIEEAKNIGVPVLYGDSVAKETMVWTNKGYMPIEDLFLKVSEKINDKEYYYPDDIEVLTLDKNGKSCFSKVGYVMRHKINKKLYRIWFTNLTYLDVTADHSIIGLYNKNIKKKPLLERFKIIKPIEFGNKIKSLIYLSKIPRNKINSRNYITEVYEFLGRFLADGCFESSKNNYNYSIAFGLDIKNGENLLNTLKKNGWIKNYFFRSNGKGDARIWGGKLSFLLNELRSGKGAKKTPEFIFNETEENIKHFLRGLFDGDGTIIHRPRGSIIRYTSINEDLIKDIKKLLWFVGISSNYFKENRSNKYLAKISNTYSKHLHIKSTIKYMKEIGFSIERKSNRFNWNKKFYTQKQFENFDFINIKVQKIEEIEYNNYVYDLQVETTQTFFANEILVHNTDSVFLKNPSKTQIDSIIDWSVKTLGIDLDVDKVYRYVALSDRKKNYLGVYESGNVDIKGLTGKKKHVPNFIQDAFTNMIGVLSEVRNESEFIQAKDEIKSIATKIYQLLNKKKIPLAELAFKVQMNKPLNAYTKTTPQHIKAAKLLANEGKEVKAGDIISFVKTRNDLGVKPIELADWRDIDTDKYKESIESTFDQVLDALGIDFKEIMGVKKLSEFFS